MATFPPSSVTTLTKTIPSYLYKQYQDDADLQAFVDEYNAMSQYYVNWFSTVGLPVYTGLSGSLLDWIAEGLYDLSRPTVEVVGSLALGPYNTVYFNRAGYPYDAFNAAVASQFFVASDDLFKRILTWHLYRGDGKVFSILWLKNRVLRFLKGANGTDVSTGDISQISVSIASDFVTIDLTRVTGVDPALIATFNYLIEGDLLELPPIYVFQVIT